MLCNAKVSGNGIPGDTTVKEVASEPVADCIEVLSLNESLSQDVDASIGLPNGRTAVQPFRLVKRIGPSTPIWRDALLKGLALEGVFRIYGRNPDDGNTVKVMEIEFLNALVTDISLTASPSSQQMAEVVSVLASRIVWTILDGGITAEWIGSESSK